MKEYSKQTTKQKRRTLKFMGKQKQRAMVMAGLVKLSAQQRKGCSK